MLTDYDGELGLEIYLRDSERILHVLRLVLEKQHHAEPYMFTGYRISKTVDAERWTNNAAATEGPIVDGPDWLVLYTRGGGGKDVVPFIGPTGASAMAAIVAAWATEETPHHRAPGIDGSVESGALHAVGGWQLGRTEGCGAAIAFRRVWAVYGK